MKTTMLFVINMLLPVLLFSATGVGIIIGEPTGISLKSWTGSNTAIDGALAYSFADSKHFYVHANFLRHNSTHFEKTQIPWYWGFGANIRYREKADDSVKLAGRIPLGINYMFEEFPSEVFLEVSPALDVVPAIDFSFGAAIGFRIYFR